MRMRILGFAAALAALAWLGHSLVGMPVLLQQILPGSSYGESYGEGYPPEGAEAPVETETPLEQPPQQAPAEEEAGESPEALRRQAQEAQDLAAELLQRSQEELDRSQRAQERADALEAGEVEEAPPPEEEEEITDPAVLAARITALEERLSAMETEQDASEEEIAALQDELDALDAQGERLEVHRQQRIERLGQGMDEIRAVSSLLATGNGDVGAALDSLAQQLGATSGDAARYAGEEEARHAAAAQDAVRTAQRLLGQQDLYNARIALGIALSQARSAQRAAQTSGPNPLSPNLP